MKTLFQLGPADHGKVISNDDFAHAQFEPGHHYEIIAGRLLVSPAPNFNQEELTDWIRDELKAYLRTHREVINRVYTRARVYVPDQPELTVPEPDLAVYAEVPADVLHQEINWEQISPILVVEVLSADDPDKDLKRNVELYLQVPSIREYWILDPRPNPAQPKLIVYRRRGTRRQRPIEVSFGGTYSTKLLPDFILTIDPQRR